MTITALDAARSLTDPIGALGGMWLLHPDTLGPCREAGYPNGYAYYMTGRGGVLGDVDADVVVSAFAFFAPSLVHKMWTAGTAVESARASAARYREACAAFGRSRLAGFDGAERLADLAGSVVNGVDSSGLALFAGWRAEPLPVDAPARAYQLLHVLRELRGSQHIVGVVASGLSPRDAILAGPGGAAQAEKFGWTAPLTPVPDATQRRAKAEAITDELNAAVFEVLDGNDRAELVSLVFGLAKHLGLA
jgi:hypothetical protein